MMSVFDGFIVGSYIASCPHLVHFLSTFSYAHVVGAKFGIGCMDPKPDHGENIRGVQSTKL